MACQKICYREIVMFEKREPQPNFLSSPQIRRDKKGTSKQATPQPLIHMDIPVDTYM
jgi:hypothetical protein